MLRYALLVCLALLTACYASFNWRDVRPEDTTLALLMPCKPDQAKKTVPLAGASVELRLLACDAGGATFSIAVVDVQDAARSAAAIAQWQSATLASIQAAPPTAQPFSLAGGVHASKGEALGKRPNGEAVRSQTAYFAKGSSVFQAAIYAATVSPDAADTFFTSLKFE
jgi:hypothetical protein